MITQLLHRIRRSQLGSGWMLVAGVGFAIMGALVKTGAHYFSSAELVFYRSAFGFLAIAIIVTTQKRSIHTPFLGKQLARAGTGFVALILFFYALTQLPLATAITLNYTSPLFLALLAPWWLHSDPHLTRRQVWMTRISVCLGFVGVVCLLQPAWSSEMWFAGGLGLLSGVGAAFAYLHVKQLGQLAEPDWRTVFYFTGVCTFGSGIWMLFTQITPLSWAQVPLLVGLGISATASQLAMTRAYRTGHTLTVATLAYSTVVFATIIGVIYWEETLSNIEFIGIVLVIVSGIVSARQTANP